MIRTHIAVTLLFVLLLLPFIKERLIFFVIALASCLLPDIDSMHSFLGQKKFFRPLQWAIKHRGLFHSFNFCLFFSLLFAFYLPKLSLPFFVGYGSHLIADGMTIEGIRPFWPLKTQISGKIRTGGKTEKALFYVLITLNILLILRFIF